ncbi:MAG: hypothetical protein JJE13_13235 [Thermoleophilia bacterium]|nr:hypothetical protein [Thermoleophilia bacterium]
MKTFGTNRKSHLFFAAFLGAALLVAALTIGSAGSANADSSVRAKKTKVLGAIGKLPEPLCPGKDCSALAIVSGFQADIDGVSNSYRIPFNGFVTKWKISLGDVTKSERTFFQKLFGKKPKAGISILKPVKVDGKREYKLMKRSPIVGLNKYLGDVASIPLARRIKVKKGWYVALTVPTWAPALGEVIDPTTKKPDMDFSWRASRERDTCEDDPNMKNSEPQMEPNSKRSYGCRFYGRQLLYRVKVTNQ